MSSFPAPWGGRFLRLWSRGLRIWRKDGWRTLLGRSWQKALKHIGIAPSQVLTAKDYHAWIKSNEPDTAELGLQTARARALAQRPLVSIITPVFNPPFPALRDALASARAQTYDRWELCIADGNSTRAGVRSTLEEHARTDGRIRLVHLEKNLGIAGNTNEAIDMARGEFIAFLDHDDVLAPDMLFEVVARINARPDADILYFDEDLLSEDGTRRFNPLFKPDWSPDMLLSANYLTHAVLRAELVRQVGRFDPATDGAQDWDFIFRCVERTVKVEHIPRILYHWRQVQGSCAGREATVKPHARENQLRAVAGHLKRSGIENASVQHVKGSGIIQATWPPEGKKVSIIIPTRDKVDFLKKCLSSVLGSTTYPDFEVIIVDNGSKEKQTLDYYEELRKDGRIRFVDYSAAFNYSRANNLGAAQARGDFLLFLNNDTEALDAGWLDELVRWAERPGVGIVGARLLFPGDTIQHAGVILGLEGHASHLFWGASRDHAGIFGSVEWYRNYLAVTGACMMIPRVVFDRVDGFDEGYQLAFSDVEICLRVVELGYRIVYTPFATLRHYEGKTRFNDLPIVDLKRGYLHMKTHVEAGDPYFNPNLSYAVRMPKLRDKSEEARLAQLHRILQELDALPASA